MTMCQYFALCENEAEGTVENPVLGAVPACQRCADRVGARLEAPRCACGAYGSVMCPDCFDYERARARGWED